MPVYPGTEQPSFDSPVSIEEDGFLEKKITLFSHTGTHVDAPAHMREGAITLDKMGINEFIGSGFVINVRGQQNKLIEKEMLISYEERLKASDFAIIYSGWSDYWGREEYFKAYPVLSEEAIRWICGFDLKGIGVDMISVDPVGSSQMQNHLLLFAHNLIIIENLTGIASLVDRKFIFSCLPLKIDRADGAPTRAVAIL
jgi:kynurenine formamidase